MTPKRAGAPHAVAAAEVVNLLEETLEPATVASGAVELAFRPWEIKAVRVRWERA